MSGKKEDTVHGDGEEDEESWVDLLQRIDSTHFTRHFRNLVLVAGLLHLRESSDAALKDLWVIIQETESFSRRISLAKEKHPDIGILKSIERNLGEFSFQTDGFQKALNASELRCELELLSLCLLLSRSPTPESRIQKIELARRLTRLARHVKMKDDILKVTRPSPDGLQLPRGERDQ